MKLTLVALVAREGAVGVVASQEFGRVEDAELHMMRWARFGIQGCCDEPSEVLIFNEKEEIIRRWNWRKRMAVDPRHADLTEIRRPDDVEPDRC